MWQKGYFFLFLPPAHGLQIYAESEKIHLLCIKTRKDIYLLIFIYVEMSMGRLYGLAPFFLTLPLAQNSLGSGAHGHVHLHDVKMCI